MIASGFGFAAESFTARSDPPPAMLGDTTITVTDSAGTPWQVGLYSVSPGQAMFLLPDGVAAGAAWLRMFRRRLPFRCAAGKIGD